MLSYPISQFHQIREKKIEPKNYFKKPRYTACLSQIFSRWIFNDSWNQLKGTENYVYCRLFRTWSINFVKNWNIKLKPQSPTFLPWALVHLTPTLCNRTKKHFLLILQRVIQFHLSVKYQLKAGSSLYFFYFPSIVLDYPKQFFLAVSAGGESYPDSRHMSPANFLCPLTLIFAALYLHDSGADTVHLITSYYAYLSCRPCRISFSLKNPWRIHIKEADNCFFFFFSWNDNLVCWTCTRFRTYSNNTSRVFMIEYFIYFFGLQIF